MKSQTELKPLLFGERDALATLAVKKKMEKKKCVIDMTLSIYMYDKTIKDEHIQKI